MATNECSASQINSNNLSNDENDNNMPLYAESKHTRQQAIGEIANIILRSDMQPQSVESILQLLKILLPPDNTLPTTIDELFRAMMSSENDWRLAQYFTRYRQYQSLLSTLVTNDNLLSTQQDNESNSTGQTSSAVFSSNCDNGNGLSPYETLHECLVPIIRFARDSNINLTTEIHLNVNNDTMRSSDQQLQSTCSTIDQSTIHNSFERLQAEERLPNERVLFNMLRQFEDSDDETSSNHSRKPHCFEMNGRNILNGSKRHRYF